MRIISLLVGMLAIAACTNAYLSADQQACIVNTGFEIQNDPAAVDLRPTQKAALIADACGVSIDAILFSLAEDEDKSDG